MIKIIKHDLLSSSTTVQQIPNWYMKADYVETCNCDFGCPCNFNGFPTYGYCRELTLYHIKQGNYGDNVKLDGLDVIYAASWPKAIHEGNGTLQLFITKNANEKQRQVIVDIFTGKAIFGGTLKYILDPQYVDIISNIDGRKSSFQFLG